MLTRCPSCATHFRVTPEQLKARSGRVRCGECQNVFNALDSLIEEPVVVTVPAATVAVPPAPTFAEMPESPQPSGTASAYANETEAEANPASPADQIAVPPTPTFESVPEALAELPTSQPETRETPIQELPEASEAKTVEPPADEPVAEPLASAEPGTTDPDTAADAADAAWSSTFPEPPPPPRRWPWVVGSLAALVALVLQAALAFRVELVVLWPESKAALVALCEIADCEVGLPAKAALVGIEASDLHPDSEHKGRLVLAATLKNRAPFAQQFPHLELTLTDTADQAIARKVLAPADYLSPKTPVANGMQPNADIMVAIGIDSGEMTASGYRLYLFYP